jgi:Nif-specific regulatory protein
MQPRLVAVNGVLKGETYELPEGEISIGRDPSNQIVLNDQSVSNRHCLFNITSERVVITDLGSFNSTLVNGVPVSEKTLTQGDQVAVGENLFFFLSGSDESSLTLKAVHLEDEDLMTRSTVRLQKENALYLKPENVMEDLPSAARIARDLNALLKISMTISSVRSSKALQQRLLELILEVIPAERGAIIQFGTIPGEATSLVGWNRQARSEQEVRVSQTIIKQVSQEGDAVLSNDVLESSSMGKAESLRLAKTRSLLCVPLTLLDEIVGVIYLDTTDESVKFDEEHLQLMMGIAGLAAVALENTLYLEWIENENQQLLEASQVTHQMIGNSTPMRKIYRMIGHFAPTDLLVLIHGESGTGKELAAHAIHLNSLRADGPFVAVNCAAFADTLFENEFFGHEREAYSGAATRRKGLLEAADGGTMFLDEIGDLTSGAQAKLLRVIEAQEFRRVGGTEVVHVDIRVVAATNRNLKEAVMNNTFRADLYHRLNGISFEMPPLRERGDDILSLTSYFIQKYNQKYKRGIANISREARAQLMAHSWAGNVRELKNTIERAVVMSGGDLLTTEFLPATLPLELGLGDEPSSNIHEAVKEAQKRVIINGFKQAKCNYTETANIIGVHPTHLHRLIRNLNLKPTLIQLTNRTI